MAYIPPHKRVSQTLDGPPPATAIQTMVVQPEDSLNLISSICGNNQNTSSYGVSVRIADHYISTGPATDDEQLPSSVCLVPICPLVLLGPKRGEKQLILVNTSNNNHLKQERNDIKSCDMEQSWTSLAETLHRNLLSVFDKLSSKQVDQKLFLLARLGKVVFRWHPSFNQDFSGENNPVSYSYLKGLRKNFYTNLPIEYVEHVKNVVIPDLGFEFEDQRELFLVKLQELDDDESIICCKCRVLQDQKKVQVYKIEKEPGRQLFQDIYCVGSNVDIRLALYRKKTLAYQDGEMQSIRDLISSAIIDSNVEGGLKWPLGTTSAGGQYCVRAVWHTKTEYYMHSFIKLKVRAADRFNFFHSTDRDVTREVVLKLYKTTNTVLEGNEAEGVLAMLKDALILIRSHFLAYDYHLFSCSES